MSLANSGHAISILEVRGMGTRSQYGGFFFGMTFVLALCSFSQGWGTPPKSASDSLPPQQPEVKGGPAAKSQRNQSDTIQRRTSRFQKLLSGVTLIGRFTIDGNKTKDEFPQEEEYTITSATPLGGELWLITSRIKYGDVDTTVPVPVVVKWAGDTPMITLDNITLPGMGTFSARVFFHRGRYAGTWQHDDIGGHMFGSLTHRDKVK